MYDQFTVFLVYLFACQVFHLRKNLCIKIFSKSFFHTAITYMAKVFQPFEIGNGYTTGIEIHIRNNQYSSSYKLLICIGCQWTVCSFANNFCFYTGCVFTGDHSFECRRDEDIAFHFQCISIFLKIVCTGKTKY